MSAEEQTKDIRAQNLSAVEGMLIYLTRELKRAKCARAAQLCRMALTEVRSCQYGPGDALSEVLTDENPNMAKTII